MFWFFVSSLLMWAISDDGQFTIGTCYPQVYSQERAMNELMRQMDEDGSLKEILEMRKEWEAFFKDTNDNTLGKKEPYPAKSNLPGAQETPPLNHH